jgi:uncharacterized protein YndB with AHSA1/START domain
MSWLELEGPSTLPASEDGTSWLATSRRRAIRVRRRFLASPQRVFDAWLDPEIAGTWLFATASRPVAEVAIDARVDGAFRLVERRGPTSIEYTGEYLEIAPQRRLVFSLSLPGHPQAVTRVTVQIAPLEQGCELRLTHDDVPEHRAEDAEARWVGILYGLGVTLDPDAVEFHNHQE